MTTAEVTVTEFEVIRIAEDRHGKAFVDVLIKETGQEKRLYEQETLSLVVDIEKLMQR